MAARRGSRRGRTATGQPNPVDVHVGGRVRQRRTLLGMSQEKLGESIGLTFQQVQKYERGANRIGASRLFDLSLVLDVPVAYFFEELPSQIRTHEGQMQIGLSDLPQDALERDPMARRETLELVRAYYAVGNPKVRRRIVDLVRSLGGEED